LSRSGCGRNRGLGRFVVLVDDDHVVIVVNRGWFV
jgi:hypothetical protein